MKIKLNVSVEKEFEVPSPCRIGSAYVAAISPEDNEWLFCYADGERPSLFVSSINADEAERAISIDAATFNDAFGRTMNNLNKIQFDF